MWSLPLGEGEGVSNDLHKSAGSPAPYTAEVADVTSEERRRDKEARTKILLGLLQLACAMVRDLVPHLPHTTWGSPDPM